MDLTMTMNNRAAVRQLLESDIARLQEELNYRLLMESGPADRMLWVERITVTRIDRPDREQRAQGKPDTLFRRLESFLLKCLEMFWERFVHFKDKKI